MGILLTVHISYHQKKFRDVFVDSVTKNPILSYNEVKLEFPVILIDLRFLRSLPKKRWDPNEDNIKIAVHIRDGDKLPQEYLQRYEIVYYEQPLNKSYLLFQDEVTRIIPNISLESYGNLSIPQDVEQFAKFWERSEIRRCIGLEIERSQMKPYLPVKKTLQNMILLQEYLISLNVYPFLFGGTLLGWFRECGIIPHTKDIDFAAFIEEYKPEVLEELQKNKKLFLWRVLGKPSDFFEFTLKPLDRGEPLMDLFWLFSSKNESWTGGLKGDDGTKYKYTYPRIRKICACDFLGHLFWVPCDLVAFLSMEYGPKWYLDYPTSEFIWYKSHYNIKMNGKLNSKELKELQKYYK
ncbi:unnamed protein product [Cylicocyclus nassatus]|uniref:W02B3.4-like N-terminal domain-containing protein n=1 Tax=Cylicocyclus nassatus TaxID=53992 RepID=A0AA36GU68_CYLNA|nr:unnamed protein product [Cylicocyclus nassatus]